MYKFNLAFRLFDGAIKVYSVKAASMDDAISKGVAKVRKEAVKSIHQRFRAHELVKDCTSPCAVRIQDGAIVWERVA
jgi:hypothetical protein